MKYAVRKDGLGWRSVNDFEDVGPDEIYSEQNPLSTAKFDPTLIFEQVRQAREVVLNRLSGIAVAAMVSNNPAEVAACLAGRESLLAITTTPAVKAATDEQALVNALESEYEAIVSRVPESIRLAFRGFRL